MKLKIDNTIATLSVAIASIMLITEVYYLLALPGRNDNSGILGLVYLSKYMESTYKEIFFWSVLLASGVSLKYNLKIYIMLQQAFLFILLSIVAPYVGYIYIPLISIPMILFLLFFIYLNYYYRVKYFGFSNKNVLGSVLIGLMAIIIYWGLDLIP